jgi:hypothetical protein
MAVDHKLPITVPLEHASTRALFDAASVDGVLVPSDANDCASDGGDGGERVGGIINNVGGFGGDALAAGAIAARGALRTVSTAILHSGASFGGAALLGYVVHGVVIGILSAALNYCHCHCAPCHCWGLNTTVE